MFFVSKSVINNQLVQMLNEKVEKTMMIANYDYDDFSIGV